MKMLKINTFTRNALRYVQMVCICNSSRFFKVSTLPNHPPATSSLKFCFAYRPLKKRLFSCHFDKKLKHVLDDFDSCQIF